MTIDPRNGAPKRLTDTATVPGMVRQTKPSHEFLHGAPVDDEPPEKSYTRETPIHPATPSRKDRGEHVAGLGNKILADAANLGRKPVPSEGSGRA
jgi:hypothetical protein